MSWADALTLAVRDALRRRVRSGLTAAGVALGSGLLVALALITTAADARVVANLGQGGPITVIRVTDALPRLGQLDSDSFQTAGAHSITNADLAAMRRSPHVDRVIPVVTAPVEELPAGSTGDYTDVMVGVDLSQARLLPINVLAGRLPEPGSPTEVAATTDFLEKTGGSAARPQALLGRRVLLTTPRIETDGAVLTRSFKAVVVGVVTQELTGDGDFVVPLAQAAAGAAWEAEGAGSSRYPLPSSPYSGAAVVAASVGDLHDVRAELYAIGYATAAPEHLVAAVQQYLGVVNIVLGSIGSVALAVALLSVANALLAALHERRREIGVIKAIGGRDRDVLRWFLIEALGLGLAGGAVGAVAGIVIAELVGLAVNQYLVAHHLGSLDLIGVPVLIPLLGWLGMGALSVAAGSLPALSAARLPAREAVVEA